MSTLFRVPFLYLLIFANFSLAQTRIIPQYLTIDEGLSQGYISALCQDEDGFLWIGTKNGLNRYDGKNFEIFTHDPNDPFSISNDWLTNIVDLGEFLFITSNSEQIDLFHKRTKRFYQIPLRQNGVKSFTQVREIYQESPTTFWLNTINNYQLLRVSFPPQFWDEFPKKEALLLDVQSHVFKDNYAFISPLGDQHLVMASETETVTIDLKSLELQELDPNSPHKKFRPFKQITERVGVGNLNFGSDIFQPIIFKQGIWQKTPQDFDIHFIFDAFNDQIWFQEYNTSNIYVYDQQTISSKENLNHSDALFEVDKINSKVNVMLRDRSEILWLGTGGLGLRKISPRKLKIKMDLSGISIYEHIYSITPEEFLIPSLPIAHFEDQSNNKNLTVIKEEIEKYQLARLFWSSQSPGTGWLLLGVQKEAGLEVHILRLEQEKLEEKQQFFIDKFWPESTLTLLEGKENQLYLFFTDNCIQYNPVTGQEKRFKLDIADQTTIYYPAQTANGNIWLGTNQGLIQGIPNGDGFDFNLIEVGSNRLQNPDCASLLTDPKDPNILWIGTKGGGLHRLDTRTMQFEYITTKEGLPNNVIYGVLNDEEGNLWMSSNKGIIRYNPNTKKIRNFTVEDGLQSNEFNTFAFGKSPDGKLFFGGINGLNSFYPKDLKDNPFAPNVKITNLEVNNNRVEVGDSSHILEQAIEYTSSITLPYAQNNITLTFAALEFTAPGKNSFSYYLEGAEKPWIHTTTDNRAPYLNLAPGSYTFRIKAANGDGVWSEKFTSLEIIIRSPWYRSTWAYLIYGAAFLGLIWWFLWFQRSKLQLAYKAEIEEQRAERLQELNAFRSRFYTNITHEFRTPLTVILGMAQQQKESSTQPKQIQKASLIERNGQRLLNLINQILDLSKIESNQLELHYEQGDIVQFIRYLAESFSTLANAQNILVQVESKEAEIWMDYDAEKTRQIISNLLSNAIKFTPSGGRINVEITQIEGHLQIVVSDTGKGIPAAELPFIFDRFYQVKDPGRLQDVGGGSSGIGLALTQELVHLLKGTIKVESQLEKGTRFIMQFPIHRDAPIRDNAPIVEPTVVAPSEQEYQPALSNSSLPSLLIIEDNADVVTFLTSCLDASYQLAFAFNGAAGIAKALEMIPDIIISDVMMPEKTGFEVTETLKKDERTSHIPIVLLTAKAGFDSKMTGLKSGADSYLTKPFKQEELLVTLQNLLDIRKNLQNKYQKWATAPINKTSSLPTENAEQRFLNKLNQTLEKHLDNSSLKAEDIAKMLEMSRTNLYLKLSALTGMSFNAYLRSLRLNKAKQLLETTDLQVAEIAFQVGFASPAYFGAKFMEQFGISPGKFRKQ